MIFCRVYRGREFFCARCEDSSRLKGYRRENPTFKVNVSFPRRLIATDLDRIVLVCQVRSLIPRWPSKRSKNNLSTGSLFVRLAVCVLVFFLSFVEL